jgi:hypothetical protein
MRTLRAAIPKGVLRDSWDFSSKIRRRFLVAHACYSQRVVLFNKFIHHC